MVGFVRLSEDRPVLDASTRILKAAEVTQVLDAEAYDRETRAKADAVLEEAKAEFERQKAAGYTQGTDEGKAEIAAQMTEMVGRSIDYLGRTEGAVAETVLLCLRKILGEFDDGELVVRQARTALRAVGAEKRVTLRVSTDNVEAARERIGEIQRGNKEVGYLEVIGDAGLSRGDCRLETDAGVVDASLDIQLSAIERALRSKAPEMPS
ncbi:MAG: HrpE/YscL family type III secretion apparatus protein [Pseudomonadota bacterium]